MLRSGIFAAIAACVLMVGACHGPELEQSPVWNPQPGGDGAIRAQQSSGTQLLSRRGGPAGKTEIIPGSGQFIEDVPRRSVAATSGAGAHTLNLVDVPVSQAAQAVLGDIVGAPYVIDPKVTGKVTVVTPRPVGRDVMLEMFEAALKTSGAAIVESGSLYKIVPADQATSAGSLVRVNSRSNTRDRIGSAVEYVQLRFVSANDMKHVLEPIVAKGGVVRADEARNVLTLSGTPDEIATMKDSIAIFDVDTLRGMTFAIVPVQASDPDALVEDLKTVFATEKDGPMSGQLRFIGNKRLAAVLIISPQRRYIARAESWIRKLDARAQGGEKQFYTYRVQNRPAPELVQILNSMFGSEVGAINKQNNVAPRTQPTTTSSIFGQGGAATGGASTATGLRPSGGGGATPGLTTGAVGGPSTAAGIFGQGATAATPAAAAAAPTAAATQTGQLGEDARFKIGVDESKNSLVIIATPDDYKRLLGVIQGLDQLPNQVLIEAIIAEVSLNDQMKFGVRWALQKSDSQGLFTNDIAAGVSSVLPGFSYLLKGASAQVTLNALNKVTNVNVISSPSLTVLDNKTATLQIGDQVPITTQSATSTLVTGAPVVNSVSYRDTGVILSITPHINESGRVLLDIEQEVSSVSQTTTSNIDSPTIQQRKIKTSVVLNDGEALTLGGLIQNKRTKANDKIPLLGDIPIIGNAFKVKDDTAAKTELVIMIAPRVIRSLAEAQATNAEFRAKIERIGRPAIEDVNNRDVKAKRLLR